MCSLNEDTKNELSSSQDSPPEKGKDAENSESSGITTSQNKEGKASFVLEKTQFHATTHVPGRRRKKRKAAKAEKNESIKRLKEEIIQAPKKQNHMSDFKVPQKIQKSKKKGSSDDEDDDMDITF